MKSSQVTLFSWPKIADLATDVANGKTSALDNVEKSLALIKENDENYNAIISTCDERAL